MEKVRRVVWKHLEGEGLGFAGYWGKDRSKIRFKSGAIVANEQIAYHARYIVECGDRTTRKVSVEITEGVLKSRQLQIGKSSEDQKWFNHNNQSQDMKEFEGCKDVDISGTPLTKSLPISHIDWQVGQSEDLKMLYISVPDLTLSVSQQRYTCLEQTADGALFRFELIDKDFETLLSVDADGLVIEYPGRFKRLWLGPWEDIDWSTGIRVIEE